MGKYMRKTKMSGEVAVMELAQSSLGVRTRAKTLALQRLQKTTTPPSPTNTDTNTPTTDSSSCSSYLQLRSRRLEKKPLSLLGSNNNDSRGGGGGVKEEGKESFKTNPNPNSNARTNSKSNSRFRVVDSLNSASGTASPPLKNEEEGVEKNGKAVEAAAADEIVPENLFDLGIEASFGENVLEIEGRGRSTRETTPCSLIRGSDTVGTPGSTTRPTNSSATNRRLQNAMRRNIPTANEMEEFFAGAEQQQQRLFAEKYNFDPVTESPLPGRFEWERVDA